MEDAHLMGIRIVLDVAFPFCGRSFFAFQDLQEKREASAYCDWFLDLDFSKQSSMGDYFFLPYLQGVGGLSSFKLRQ